MNLSSLLFVKVYYMEFQLKALIDLETVTKIEGICDHRGVSLYSLMDFAEVVSTLLTAKIFEEKLPTSYSGKW